MLEPSPVSATAAPDPHPTPAGWQRPEPRQQPEKLRVRGVSKAFRARTGRLSVLENIDLSVAQGEFVCLLGPSGCGKSTLFNIIAGLERPDAGTVLVDGRPIAGPGPDRVVVFQEAALFPWLTVLGNVEFGLALRGAPVGERRTVARRCLELVHLGRFADAFVHELSGGMRQRVAIARALALRPQVLLMDEPFAALDAQTRNVMHEELQEIVARTEATVLFVTHNVSEAVRLADRLIVMSFRPGRIKRIVNLRHPRPRRVDDPHLIEIQTFVLRELREEVDRSVREELGDE